MKGYLIKICTVVVLILAPLAALASTDEYDLPDDIEEDTNPQVEDKLENLNRKVFCFNKALDKMILAPTTETYRKITFTSWSRKRISNFLSNLYEPNHMINNILSGRMDGFFTSGARFVINSTVGLGGLFDPASKLGVKKNTASFREVMSEKLCIKNGQYIMLPVFGPSTSRNAIALGIDKIVLDPFSYILPLYGSLTRFGVEIISVRNEKADIINQIKHDALDEYAMLRGLYYQSDEVKEYTHCCE